jgi:RNA polymerase sigma-70 factor, ECF subfamily
MRTDPEHLLHEARRGKEAAFLSLVDEHRLPLFRFALRLTNSMADAEDIVQECFLSLLRPNCGFDASRTALRNYLFGVVRNQSLKRLRGREHGGPGSD